MHFCEVQLLDQMLELDGCTIVLAWAPVVQVPPRNLIWLSPLDLHTHVSTYFK